MIPSSRHTRSSAQTIDAHQHFWRYSDAEFGWISEPMAAIRRNFLPADLQPLLDENGIGGTVAVQARQSIDETEWLLELADENTWITGVVGWVDLVHADVEQQLERLSKNRKLRGIRHVLQGEEDTFMDRADFNRGISLLREYSLVYDLLILERQLPAAIRFVDCHPNQPFVLDHVAKPLIATREQDPWGDRIREVAKRPNVSCKLSGMVTEADFGSWTTDDLRPYVETVLEAFGSKRLIFGSDWPVCTVAATYAQWISTARELFTELNMEEQALIFGGNAIQIYGLDVPVSPRGEFA